MNAGMKTCEVCEAADTELEAVLFPTEVGRLFAMLEHYHDDLDAWPSLWVCDACAEATRGLFASLAEAPAPLLVRLTSDVLRELAREIRRR